MKFNDSETRGEKKLIWSEINKEKRLYKLPLSREESFI